MKKLRTIIVLITLSFIFFLLPFNSNSNFAGAQEDEKVVFNVGFGGYFALDDLDPTLATGSETWWIYSNVVDPLFRWDWDKEEYYGVLATGFEIENLTTMLIHLRENVTFHDGTPFNAQAVKWNWEREKLIAKPIGHVSHSSWYFISDQLRDYETDDWNLDHIPPGEDYPQLREIEVVNDTCVRIISNTGRPIPPTGGFQWWAIVSPTYYAGNETASWLGHDSLIGTGPFKYVGYDQIEGLIKLEANENYWNVTPAIDEINIIQFATAEVAQTALLTGELDYMSGPPDPVSINKSEVVNLIDPQGPLGYWGTTYWIVMPLHAINVTMRKAMAYAWDYDLAIETDQNGYALPAGGVFPFNNRYYNESIPKPYHNIDIARQTLIDAGIAPSEATNWTDEQWKNRAETDPLALFPFTYPASANDIYQVLVASAATIGVEINEILLTDSQYNSNFAGPRQDRYDNLAAAYIMVLMDDGPDTARDYNRAYYHSSQYWNFANVNDADIDNWTVYWSVTDDTSDPNTQDICNLFTDKIQNEIIPHIWVSQAKKFAAMSIDFEGDTGNTLQEFQYVKPRIFKTDFSTNATEIISGQWVQFTDLTTSGETPFNYQWSFGDGSLNSTEKNPIHQYVSAGIYPVILTVIDNDGNVSIKEGISITVSDNLLPNADFTTNATKIMVGQTVIFTDLTTSGNTPLNYQWSFGDGTDNSTEQNPSHLFSSSGVYTIILTVTDSNGDVDVIEKENFITVDEIGYVISGYDFLWTIFFTGIAFFIICLRKFSPKLFKMK